MRDVTAAQDRVYQALRRHRVATGHMPSLSDVARELGIHYVSVKQHVKALARKGRVRFESRGRGKPPIVEIVGLGDSDFAAGFWAGWNAALKANATGGNAVQHAYFVRMSAGRGAPTPARPKPRSEAQQ